MKSLKLAAFALAFGIFAASCGGNKEAETTPPTDTTATAPEAQPEAAPAPAPTDTTVKPEAATTPAADTTKK